MGLSINVKSAYFAQLEKKKENGVPVYKYGTPEHIAGLEAVNIVPTVATGEKRGDGKPRVKVVKSVGNTLTVDVNKIPQEWRHYLEGKTFKNGVEGDDGSCTPKPFAFGFVNEYTDDDNKVYEEMVWFLDCLMEPIEDNLKQAEEKSVNITSDSMKITSFKVEQFNDRSYIKIDTQNADVTEEMKENFFKKVQTNYTISAPQEVTGP